MKNQLATYIYKYDLAGGLYNNSTTYSQTYNTADPSTSKLITPVRPGYKFRWFTIIQSSTGDQLGQNAAAGQQIVVASNLTLRAVWDKIYYIKYKLSGGYFDSNYTYQQEKWYGTNINLREAPKRTGYTFKGWRDSDYNGALWAAGQAWGADVNTTLTAEWSRNSSVTKATITYKLNGGTGASSATVNIGSSLTLPTPTKNGYKFSKWVSNHDNDYNGANDQFSGGSQYKYSNTVTLTAQWVEDDAYEVVYYRPKKVAGEGSALADGYEFKDPEAKTGTSFTVTNGWTTYIFGHAQDKSGEYQWFDHFIPQPINYRANVNLMSMMKAELGYLHKTTGALTETNEYDVMTSEYISVTAGTKYVYAYHADLTKTTGSGTTHPWTRIWFYNSSKNIISGSMKEYGESDSYINGENLYTYTITAPSGASYIRISSRFLRFGFGQLTTEANWNETFTPSTYDYQNMPVALGKYQNPDKTPVYLLGVFYANEKTVTYNANGGSPTPSPSSFKTWYDRPFKFTTTKPSKAGTNFLGWSADKNAGKPTWVAGEDYKGQNHSYTVYAVWSVNYKLTYNANGGTGAPPSETREGNSIKALSTTKPTRTGYTFLGWSLLKTATKPDYQPGDDFEMFPNDTVLYAVWDPKEYTLTYNANGGSGAPPSEKRDTDSKKALSSTQPTRDGYNFLGWATTSTASNPTYQPGATYTMPASNTTLYAVWDAKSYTLTYNANGGSGAPVSEKRDTDSIKNLSTTEPTRNGFTFLGWATSSGADAPNYQPGDPYTMPPNDVTLYAVWSEVIVYTFSIVYNANGGSGAPDNETYTSTTSMVYQAKLSTTKPTRTGYDFLGWSKSQEAEVAEYEAGETITINKGTTYLYAVWKVKSYSLIYNANGGTNAPTTESREYDSVKNLSSKTPTRVGYTFKGWGLSAITTTVSYHPGDAFTMPANNVTLYAVWEVKSYQLSYNANGGTGAPSEEEREYGSNQALSSVIPTREGYEFLGWNTDKDASSATYQAGDLFPMPSNDVELFAIWSITSFKLTYNANGGTGAPSQETREYNSIKPLSSTKPTRPDYNFLGWAYTDDAEGPAYQAGDNFIMPSYNVTLYAVWAEATKYTFTLIYNANGGSGEVPSTQSYTSTTEQTHEFIVGTLVPTREGYTFDGWNFNKDAANGMYHGGESVSVAVGTFTFYAIWIVNKYELTYHANGGSGAPEKETRNYNSTSPLSSTIPTREGYEFLGWNTNKDASTALYSPNQSFTMPASNTILYAIWKIKSYQLTYNANGGSGAPEKETREYNSSLPLSEVNPVKEGSTFLGWDTNAMAYTPSYQSGQMFTMPASDVILYAIYSSIGYTLTYDTNGGEGGPSTEIHSYNDIFNLSQTIPTKLGNDFKGWLYNGITYQAGEEFTMPNQSVTLTAQWEAKEYTVTYHLEGGSGNIPTEVHVYNESFSISQTIPQRLGYTFNGWGLSSSEETVSYIAGQTIQMPANNLDLYAKWSNAECNFQFILYKGTDVPEKTVTLGGSINEYITPPDASTPGYTFKGWTTKENSDTPEINPGEDILIDDVTKIYYPIYTINKYSISYVLNGGTGNFPSSSHDYNTTITLPDSAPVYPGHDFTGWYLNPEFTGAIYQPSGSFKIPAKNVTFYASYGIQKYQLIFDTKGGTPAIDTISLDYGSTVNLPSEIPSIANGVFRQWLYTEGEITTTYHPNDEFTLQVEHDVTFVADYIYGLYVTFDANGGSNPPDGLSYTGVATEYTFTLPEEVPIRKGYTFLGWSELKTASTPTYTTGSLFTTDTSTTLYAIWSVNEYAIHFNTNGSSDTIPSIVADYGDTIEIPDIVPTRPGFDFNGWAYEQDGEPVYTIGDSFILDNYDITFYAVWVISKNKFVITFDSNGGDLNVPSTIIVEDRINQYEFQIPNVIPNRTGYNFDGWCTNKIGTGISYGVGETVIVQPGNTTLYAVWFSDSKFELFVNYNGTAYSLRKRN